MAATILCVEDEEDLRKDIVEELRDAGYELLEAENGKIALETIIASKPDLVLCDISMPVMGGYELLEEIKSNHPDRCDLPFVFLTALADRSHIVMGKKLGADDYLTKPVDYELLLAAVEARLEHAQRVKERHKEQLVRVYKAAVEELSQTPGDDKTASDAARLGVEQHLQSLVTESPTKVVAGRVQLVGLDDVKAALGDRWTRRSDVIYDLIERTIRTRLAASDVFQRDRDGNFTICFASLNETEAAFKARAIAEEIRGKILGMDLGPGAAPLSAEDRTFFEDVARGGGQGRPLTVEGDAHEIELGVDEVAETEDLLGLLTSRLAAAAAVSKKTERAMLVEMVEQAGIQLHSFVTQQGEVTPFQFAAFDRDSQEKVVALRANHPASHDLVRDLDVLLLSKVIEEILRRPPGKNIILVVNVHFSTIENKHRLEHFKKVCETLTDPARAALIFNIVEIPHNLLPAKIAEYFLQIRHFCRAMMAECPMPSLGNLDPQMLRTPILSYKAADFVKALTRNPGDVAGFLKQLRQKKIRLLVYGIAGEQKRAKIRAAGVDFLTMD
jgi:DNA-binding response OmpR family regulator